MEGGRFSCPYGPGAHSRASQETDLWLRRDLPSPSVMLVCQRQKSCLWWATAGGVDSAESAAQADLSCPIPDLTLRCVTVVAVSLLTAVPARVNGAWLAVTDLQRSMVGRNGGDGSGDADPGVQRAGLWGA